MDKAIRALNRSVAHAKRLGVDMFVAPDHENKAWELESIERKSGPKGSGSTALKHLMRTADKHKKVLYLNAAGRQGNQAGLENYYKKHGFVSMKGKGSLPGDMYRPLHEDAPTNSMGLSSSVPGTGSIDIFNPLLKANLKKNRRDKLISIWRRASTNK
jgi:hypothetical protein